MEPTEITVYRYAVLYSYGYRELFIARFVKTEDEARAYCNGMRSVSDDIETGYVDLYKSNLGIDGTDAIHG